MTDWLSVPARNALPFVTRTLSKRFEDSKYTASLPPSTPVQLSAYEALRTPIASFSEKVGRLGIGDGSTLRLHTSPCSRRLRRRSQPEDGSKLFARLVGKPGLLGRLCEGEVLRAQAGERAKGSSTCEGVRDPDEVWGWERDGLG